ncbi:MAG: hypothetical protein K0S93_113 [Nitrososphaeraceae archaeon]|jgi:hypothetical protein|nr:hypothetical protein [Nitrososphaeraceae archaeon]
MVKKLSNRSTNRNNNVILLLSDLILSLYLKRTLEYFEKIKLCLNLINPSIMIVN